MSDGTKIMTNIWRPEVDRPVPVLLVRNPYGKDNSERAGFQVLGFQFLKEKIGWRDGEA